MTCKTIYNNCIRTPIVSINGTVCKPQKTILKNLSEYGSKYLNKTSEKTDKVAEEYFESVVIGIEQPNLDGLDIESNPSDLVTSCYAFMQNPSDKNLHFKILSCLKTAGFNFNLQGEQALVFALIYNSLNNPSPACKELFKYLLLKKEGKLFEAYEVLLKIKCVYGDSAENYFPVENEISELKSILESAKKTDTQDLSPELRHKDSLAPVDVNCKTPLPQHFLIPNELNHSDVYPHLNRKKDGIHVCTGTERLFMNAAMCPIRDEIIGIDFDDQVIAYNHYNTLLLRISKDAEEFDCLVRLSPSSKTYDLISEKICNDQNIPHTLKVYYLENLNDFCNVYFKAKREFFSLTKLHQSLRAYHKNDDDFSKLQKYAREGRFVFLKRDINQLDFLDAKNVRELDTSNICDYSHIAPKFQNSNPSDTKIIWTCLQGPLRTNYLSDLYRAVLKNSIEKD